MWKLAVSILALTCGAALAAADDGELVIPPVTYPVLVRKAPSPEAFVPAGWRIETKLSGDLNGDSRDDLFLILRGADPRNIIDTRGRGGSSTLDTNPRILAVAFANAAGGYDLALENHTLVERTTFPGEQDPLDPNGVQEGGVEIKNGTLQVTLAYFSGNMGRKTFTFRFEKAGFRLSGFDSVDVERNSGRMNDISINYLTRRMKRNTGHISDDNDKVTWKTLPQKPLLKIDQIGEGLMFEPPK